MAGHGLFRQARQGVEGHGKSRRSPVRHGRQGPAGRGTARFVLVRQALFKQKEFI